MSAEVSRRLALEAKSRQRGRSNRPVLSGSAASAASAQRRPNLSTQAAPSNSRANNRVDWVEEEERAIAADSTVQDEVTDVAPAREGSTLVLMERAVQLIMPYFAFVFGYLSIYLVLFSVLGKGMSLESLAAISFGLSVAFYLIIRGLLQCHRKFAAREANAIEGGNTNV